METAIMVLVFVAIGIIADCFGDHRRPVHHSHTYRQALTGMIREPRAQIYVVSESRLQHDARAMAETRSDMEPAALPDLTAQPT